MKRKKFSKKRFYRRLQAQGFAKGSDLAIDIRM